MIKVSTLIESFKNNGVEFFTGVPDSLLKDFCQYINDNSNGRDHIITANEGGAIALATGYYLATGKTPLIYLQNSGLGNIINPLLSLADKEVYGIPMIIMVGWRGEPGIIDEPQHIKQGRVQNNILDAIEIPYFILEKNVNDVGEFINKITSLTKNTCSPIAIIVKENTFEPYISNSIPNNNYNISRENAIKIILSYTSGEEIVVATTGKISRELFEYRDNNCLENAKDFLTVGSMGHASQIALGLALNTNRKVICLDGDGALLMHMGSLAITGSKRPSNLVHIILNNGAHDSVGGQPTCAFNIDLVKIAEACGYIDSISIENESDLHKIIPSFLNLVGPTFIEVKVKKGARYNLRRPQQSPQENKLLLMQSIL